MSGDGEDQARHRHRTRRLGLAIALGAVAMVITGVAVRTTRDGDERVTLHGAGTPPENAAAQTFDLGRWRLTAVFPPQHGHQRSKVDVAGSQLAWAQGRDPAEVVPESLRGAAHASFFDGAGGRRISVTIRPNSTSDSLQPMIDSGELVERERKAGRPILFDAGRGGWSGAGWEALPGTMVWVTGYETDEAVLLGVVRTVHLVER